MSRITKLFLGLLLSIFVLNLFLADCTETISIESKLPSANVEYGRLTDQKIDGDSLRRKPFREDE
jgi:hypothetical protein